MKRIIISVVVMAFAVAVYAGDGASCQDKEKAGCCANKVRTSLNSKASQVSDKAAGGCCPNKMKTSLEAKGSCPSAGGGCCMQTEAKQTAPKRVTLLSPKALDLASK
jgi:hypothetical protein